MEALTWLFFGMAITIGFWLGRKYQSWTDKELRQLAKEIVEEARKRETKEQEEKQCSI